MQRDAVQDVIHLMERHFDASELAVVGGLTSYLPSALVAWSNSLDLGRQPPRGGLAAVAVGPGTCTEAAIKKKSGAYIAP